MRRRPGRAVWPAALALLALGYLAGGARSHPPQAGAPVAPATGPQSNPQPTGARLWPFATRGFRVRPDGDLENGAWRVRLLPSADGVPAAAPARIAALDRWRPVLRWTRRAGDVRWEFEAVAFHPGPARDTGLVVSLRVRALNEGPAVRTARLDAVLAPPDSAPLFTAWDEPGTGAPALRWAVHGGRDRVQGWGGPDVRSADVATLRDEVALPPGGRHERVLLLPAYACTGAGIERLARVPHAHRVGEALEQWDRWLGEGAAFSLGDPEVENALRAARIVLLTSRERRGELVLPMGGPFQYRDVWLRDGVRAAHALVLAGHVAAARQLVAGLASLQWPNGAFLTQHGQLDGTGQALWAFEQVLLRPATQDDLGPTLDQGLAAWHWIARQRSPARGAAVRFAGLLPFGDPRDNELVSAPLVGNDAWAIAGMRGLERLLRAGGRTAQADSVASDLTGYRRGFHDALEASGSGDVPAAWSGGGRDWGNLSAGWPCAALGSNDPRLAALAARVWARAGGAGLACYGPVDSLHAYAGADLATWALLAGRRQQADSVFAAMLHWRTASGTAGEVFARDGGFGRNVPPHATSAAALVAYARNAILFDDPDTLRLTLGARERWWRGARVERAPTWWGALDVSFRRDGDAATWAWTPVPVWTELVLPPGTELAGAPPSPLVRGSRPDRVLAPPGTREARVQVAAAR